MLKIRIDLKQRFTLKTNVRRSAVGIPRFFDGHAADIDAGEIGGAETGLFGEEDMVVAEIEGLDAFGRGNLECPNKARDI